MKGCGKTVGMDCSDGAGQTWVQALQCMDCRLNGVDIPVMEMARRAKPRYFPTPLSRTIPVPLEMSMAPIYRKSLHERRPAEERHCLSHPPEGPSRLWRPS